MASLDLRGGCLLARVNYDKISLTPVDTFLTARSKVARKQAALICMWFLVYAACCVTGVREVLLLIPQGFERVRFLRVLPTSLSGRGVSSSIFGFPVNYRHDLAVPRDFSGLRPGRTRYGTGTFGNANWKSGIRHCPCRMSGPIAFGQYPTPYIYILRNNGRDLPKLIDCDLIPTQVYACYVDWHALTVLWLLTVKRRRSDVVPGYNGCS